MTVRLPVSLGGSPHGEAPRQVQQLHYEETSFGAELNEGLFPICPSIGWALLSGLESSTSGPAGRMSLLPRAPLNIDAFWPASLLIRFDLCSQQPRASHRQLVADRLLSLVGDLGGFV